MRTRGVESLADLEWQGVAEQPALRRAIRHRLRSFAPSLRILAEDFLAETSPIDLLGVGEEGDLHVVRIARAGHDATLLTEAIADRVWLQPRLEDWLKLSPELDLDPDAEIRALLLCPDFGPATRSAVRGFPDGCLQLIRYRCLQQRGQLEVLLERVGPTRGRPDRPRSTPAGRMQPGEPGDLARQTATAPESPTRFRTGLTDADLSGPAADLPAEV
jgi:hypothetical protein